jgi:hypothetical protein
MDPSGVAVEFYDLAASVDPVGVVVEPPGHIEGGEATAGVEETMVPGYYQRFCGRPDQAGRCQPTAG